MKKILTIICLLAISSCGLMPPKEMTSSFNEQDHAQFKEKGKSKISGQAFLKQNGGTVVTCAGEDVFLVPDTAYFQEIVAITKAHRKPKLDTEKETLKAVMRKSQCDAQGNFYFNDLPNANWIIFTKVTWKAGSIKQGGNLAKNITSHDEITTAILTDKDQI